MDHKQIWLQPLCQLSGEPQHRPDSDCVFEDAADDSIEPGRLWCQDNVWGRCAECGARATKYVIAPEDL